MLQIKFDQDASIATVTPSVPLNQNDFLLLASEVDPYIEKEGKLKGLII